MPPEPSPSESVPLITPPKFGQWYRPATRHVRRVQRVGILIFFASFILLQVLAAIVAARLLHTLGWTTGSNSLDRVVRVAISLLGAMVPVFIHARIARKSLERRDWQLCPFCLYAVEGLDGSNRCPECGRAFSTELLRQDFAAYQRFLSVLLPWNWISRREPGRVAPK